MRRISMSVATMCVLVAGPGVAWAAQAVSASPTTSALTCAQPTNPTVREVVNAVCSRFGP